MLRRVLRHRLRMGGGGGHGHAPHGHEAGEHGHGHGSELAQRYEATTPHLFGEHVSMHGYIQDALFTV
jgi:hypothetical protein